MDAPNLKTVKRRVFYAAALNYLISGRSQVQLPPGTPFKTASI